MQTIYKCKVRSEVDMTLNKTMKQKEEKTERDLDLIIKLRECDSVENLALFKISFAYSIKR